MSKVIVLEELLQRARVVSANAKKNMLELAYLLYTIRENDLFLRHHTSFSAYLEDDVKISEGFATKLISVYATFLENNTVDRKRIEGVDIEKLYLARRLEGSVEERLVKAETLTRSELKQELAIKDDKECQHLQTVTICSTCHVRLS